MGAALLCTLAPAPRFSRPTATAFRVGAAGARGRPDRRRRRRRQVFLRLPPPARPDYVENIWGVAAGALVLLEAGGAVSDAAG